MTIRWLLAPFAAVIALLPALSHAAASVRLVSPLNVSVLGGSSRVFQARFFDSLGNPAVGETVSWGNDACGFFSNGQFFASSVTDATGLASITFTALDPAGITCWLVGDDGVEARFNVNTYQARQVYFSTATSPISPAAGQPFTLNVSPMQGAFHLYEVDITARIVPAIGNATISPSSTHVGQATSVPFSVVPGGPGAFDVELEHAGTVKRVTMGLPANGWQDMWWAGSTENGWGMSLAQHGEKFFAVIYAYDASGKPTWYVMPAGQWSTNHTSYTGALYHPAGSPYSAYDTTRFVPGASVGTMTLSFSGYSSVTLFYTIDGTPGQKSLTRQSFGTVTATSTAPYADMWWGGASQNGWGIALLQQGSSIFGVWFTYDDTGAPAWFVMPSGSWTDATTWSGHVYRTTGSPWLGRAYDATMLKVNDVGTFSLRFAADGSAVFDYTIDGRGGSLALVRQGF